MRAIQKETRRSWLMFGTGALLSLPALAEDPDHRHDTVMEEPRPPALEGGVTAVFQHADDRRVEDEVVASLDLVATLPGGPGGVDAVRRGQHHAEDARGFVRAAWGER